VSSRLPTCNKPVERSYFAGPADSLRLNTQAGRIAVFGRAAHSPSGVTFPLRPRYGAFTRTRVIQPSVVFPTENLATDARSQSDLEESEEDEDSTTSRRSTRTSERIDQGGGEAAEGSPASNSDTPEAPKKEPEDTIAALKEENRKLKENLLRAHAEQDNIRKRGEKEVATAKRYGIANLAKSLLEVADNLERAIQSVKPENRTPEMKSLLEGVELVEKITLDTLRTYGVEKFVPVPGEHTFDPKVHNAMFTVPHHEIKAGRIAVVHTPGYKMHNRVLRHAQVGVSSGPPTTEQQSQEQTTNESSKDKKEN